MLSKTCLKICMLIACGLCLNVAAAHAEDVVPGCTTVVSLPGYWKYKPTNVHGGRGPSFILGCQAKRTWPSGRVLTILNAKGKRIGAFGLYDPGHYPYGRRYYTGVPGGSYTSASGLLTGARKGGSSNMFIKVSATKCVKVKTPTGTEGYASPTYSGAC